MNSKETKSSRPASRKDGDEGEGEPEDPSAVDPLGHRPAAMKNLKKANEKIDQLIAEVSNSRICVIDIM